MSKKIDQKCYSIHCRKRNRCLRWEDWTKSGFKPGMIGLDLGEYMVFFGFIVWNNCKKFLGKEHV